ncbi:MAG: squalene synthase HpnC [Acidobacteria bacterium]|nr:squalene synthase HpnC [Acidobacteriota bacterium]
MWLAPRDFVRSPEAMAREFDRETGQQYTRWLARHHYENFQVASLLLPKALRQDFYNLYAYCRWADDLGDEIGDAGESLRLLAWWREQLDSMYAGRARHPVLVALRETVERHRIPQQPFADLIRAFEQDQRVTRYRTRAELLDYCRYSANPVGRLVLYVCGYADAGRQELSDCTCTALQLVNFWQDVTVDLEKGRIYLPLEILEGHGCSLEDLAAGRPTAAFRAAMKEAVDWAGDWFRRGLPLAKMVDRRLAVDVSLFSRGGMQILKKIRAQDYDVLSRRPVIGKTERVLLLMSAMARAAFLRAA